MNLPYSTICYVCFTLSEIIRFSYYLTKQLNSNMYILEYLRYNAFVVLYPIGAFGEMINMYYAYNALTYK